MNSNEEYLDSLLKSVEQKEASIKEAGIVNDLSELDMFSEPADFSDEEELQDVLAVETSIAEEEDLAFLNTEDLSEEIYREEHTGIPEELLLPNMEQGAQEEYAEQEEYIEQEEARIKPEIVVQSQDATVLDILKSNPDMLISPEDLEDIFSNIGSNQESKYEDIEIPNDESETEINAVDEADENVNIGFDVAVGDSIYSENIQNLPEDDIMRLLQQSADVSGQPDNAGLDIDSLFDDMSNNGSLAQIQEMIDKAENNEPVSGEIDDMIQRGINLDAEDNIETPAPVLAPKEILGKIKVGFANIFKKEPDKKEKKDKKKKERKSLFSRKDKKNKKDKNKIVDETANSPEGGSGWADLLSWSGNDTPMADIPMWDSVEEEKTDTLSTSNEQPQSAQSDMSMLWDAIDNVKAEAADMPDAQDMSDIQDMPDDNDMLEMQKMAELMKMSEISEKPQPAQSDMSMLWDAIDNVQADTVQIPDEPEQSEMSELSMLWDSVDDVNAEAADMPSMTENNDEGLPSLDDLFDATPEVQTNNANADEIADLLSSLESDESEFDLSGADIDLFAGMEQDDYAAEPVELSSAHEDENGLAFINDSDDINGTDAVNEPAADAEEEKTKKRKPFKFNLFSRKKKTIDEDISTSDGVLDIEETSGQDSITDQADENIPHDIFGIEDIFDDANTMGLEDILEEKIAVKKEKKPGFFARLFTLLTEEDDEIDALFGGSDKNAGVDELGATSEENKEALEQLDKEGPEDKKKKKGKKGKKDKKGETKEGNGDENEDDEEPVEDNKKKKKPKKEKKEKKQKEPKFYDDSPKIPKKKIKSTFFMAATMLAAILALCLFVPELFETRSARKAFYAGDYETSYRAFYGKELSESDRIIYEQSEFLLALQRRIDSYYNFMAVNDELRAVETLIQEVSNQNQVMYEAEKHDLQAEAEESYSAVLQLLSEQYGVSEEEALAIVAYRQDALYTLHIRAIVAGEEFVCPDYLLEYTQNNADNVAQDEAIIEETLEDVLPEEEELVEEEFEEGTN